MLSYLQYKEQYWEEQIPKRTKNEERFEGWFYQTTQDVMLLTSLSYQEQLKALTKLVKLTLIEYKVKPIKRLKTVRFFHLLKDNIEKLTKYLNTKYEKIKKEKLLGEQRSMKPNKATELFIQNKMQKEQLITAENESKRKRCCQKQQQIKVDDVAKGNIISTRHCQRQQHIPDDVAKSDTTIHHITIHHSPIHQEDFYKELEKKRDLLFSLKIPPDFNKNKTSLLEKKQPMVAKNELTENEINDFVASL